MYKRKTVVFSMFLSLLTFFVLITSIQYGRLLMEPDDGSITNDNLMGDIVDDQ